MSCFLYYSNFKIPDCDKGNVQIVVPKKVVDENVVFELYSKKLNMPAYFGKNWNALYDCLTDMDFCRGNDVIIYHQDMPFKGNVVKIKLYIELLLDVVRNWLEFPEHKFYVYFPESCRLELAHIVDSREDEDNG